MRLDEPLIADPTALSWAVFAFIFGGAALGLLLRRVLPAHHLAPDSKDVVKNVVLLDRLMAPVRFIQLSSHPLREALARLGR